MKKQQLRGIAEAVLDAATDFFYGQKKQEDGTFKTVKFSPPKSSIVLLGKLIGFDMNSTDEQIINLTNGTKFIITDTILMNSSEDLDTAADFMLNDALVRAGNVFGNSIYSYLKVLSINHVDVLIAEGLSNLTDNKQQISLAKYFMSNAISGNNINSLNNVLIGDKVYASISTPQGDPATVDIYVYGYIIE